MKRRYFVFLHLKFDILQARDIAAGYKCEKRKPDATWVSPFYKAKPSSVAKANLFKPIIFATLPHAGEVHEYLIDGCEAVLRAVKDDVPFLNAAILNVPDSLFILCSNKGVRDAIANEAEQLGLLDVNDPKKRTDDQSQGSDSDPKDSS